MRTKDFKIEIGTNFKEQKRDLTITDREYRTKKNNKTIKYYKYTCNKCGWTEGWIREYQLLRDIGCSCCHRLTIVRGINDLATTNPELVKYFINIEDTYNTTFCSKKEFLMKCPNCGYEKILSTEKLSRNGFACNQCGDGISYGEKFIYSLLSQLKIDFISEYNKANAQWCKDYRYDFYLPLHNCIIEVHGLQHYQTNRKKSGKYRGYEEEHINDINKELLAKEHNIKHYIVIDTRRSDFNYVKQSILNSELTTILSFDVNDINWNECLKYTATSKIIEVCNFKKENRKINSNTIGNIFHLNCSTVLGYLKKGREIGIY